MLGAELAKSSKFYVVMVFYVMDKALTGDLSCMPTCLVFKDKPFPTLIMQSIELLRVELVVYDFTRLSSGAC